MSIMDPLARAWYMMYRERIGKEVLAAQAAVMPMPTPPVHEVPLVMDEADVIGEPPVTQTQQPRRWRSRRRWWEPEVMEVPRRSSPFDHLFMGLA
jgi:hypothetical protein